MPFPARVQRLHRLWLLLLSLVFLCAPDAGAQAGPLLERKDLAERLRYQEGLIRSAEANFEVRRTPTRPEMVPAIKEIYRLQGIPREADHFLLSEKLAKANSHKARWWRRGQKERIERFALDADEGAEPRSIAAFDGQFVRTVEDGRDGLVGAVETVDRAHWFTKNRTHPLSLIHYFTDMPYSEIVERGKGYTATKVDVRGRPGTHVFVHYPKADRVHFLLLFDADQRLVERRLITKLGSDRDFRVYEIHEFDDYKPIDNPTGDPIWVPMTVVRHYYCGQHPTTGQLVEYQVETVKITRLVFNIDIPDRTFDLTIPSKARIWDGIGGHGLLPAGEQPDYLLSPAAKARKRVWAWAAAGLALLVVLAGAYFARRRWRRAAGSA